MGRRSTNAEQRTSVPRKSDEFDVSTFRAVQRLASRIIEIIHTEAGRGIALVLAPTVATTPGNSLWEPSCEPSGPPS